ncbi:uncharacterized protein LOC129317311 [Prosopis cineraria]|uniref:uncharacterized protein LOC129317311 n=1 Tax=Prosopis cineraria TaxID=364024 RepID=UPI00240F0108|nr:uncharacterized protein LOC129317311 [Prosopis cineraria]
MQQTSSPSSHLGLASRLTPYLIPFSIRSNSYFRRHCAREISYSKRCSSLAKSECILISNEVAVADLDRRMANVAPTSLSPLFHRADAGTMVKRESPSELRGEQLKKEYAVDLEWSYK